MDINTDHGILAQAAPKNNDGISPFIKQWCELQNKKSATSEETASKIKEEFDLLEKSGVPKGTAKKISHPKFPNYTMSIMHTKGEPEFGIPEKYILTTAIILKVLNKSTGKLEEKSFLESTVTYEYYPADPEKNETYPRITKIYTQELYKKDNTGKYLKDPKTGFYITDKDPSTGYHKVYTDSKTIEIKDGKALEVTEDQDEDALLEAYMQENNLPEEAKGVRRKRSRKARKRLKSTAIDLAKLKQDYFVRFMGYPMRKSTAAKMKKTRDTALDMGYDIKVTCTTGGRHLVWQHKAGYAVDYVICKTDENGKVKYYLNKETHKKELKKVIAAIMDIKDTNLYRKDEYYGTSTYKNGDHLHAHITNPYLEATAKAKIKKEIQISGSKDIWPIIDKDIDEDIEISSAIMNGYMPSEIK